MYVFMYVYLQVDVCMCVRKCVRNAHVQCGYIVRMYVCMSVFMYGWMFVGMYLDANVCMYACTQMRVCGA